MADRSPLYQYKGNRCASCGLSVPEMVDRYGTFNRMFEFHHVDPTIKDKHYRKLMAQRLSRRQMDEIDKCVLLCTHCHAVIHAQEIVATLELSAQLNRRIAKQQFHGWIRADGVAKTLTFVTNEPYLLQPCEIRLGTQVPRTLFIIEIDQDKNLRSWLADIEQHKIVEIRSLTNPKHFMRIRHTSPGFMSVTQTLGLPITSLEFHPVEKPKDRIFIRNGIWLSSSGDVLTEGELNYTCSLLPSISLSPLSKPNPAYMDSPRKQGN